MKSIPTIHRAEQRRLLQGARDQHRLQEARREEARADRDSGGRGEAWKRAKQEDQFREWRENRGFD